jgi:hypothetical protein
VDATNGFAFEIVGTDFAPDALVTLTHAGRPDVRATRVTVVSPRQLHCVVDLPDVGADEAWTVVVTGESGTATLRDGLTITLAPIPTIAGVYVEREGAWVTPALGVTGATGVRVQVIGTNFGPTGPAASVSLTRDGRTAPLTNCAWAFDGGKVTGTVDLPGDPDDRGAWDVTVTDRAGRKGTRAGAFTITGTNLTGVMVSSDLVIAPRMAWPLTGTTVRLTAAATPTNATRVQYRFDARIFNDDTRASETTVLRDFGAETTFAWTPTVAQGYWVSVTARDEDGTAITSPELYLRFEPADLLGVRLDAMRNDDGSWTLQAASDGTAPAVEYRFAVSVPIDGTAPVRYATTTLRGYAAEAAFRWTPLAADAGKVVRITVYARTVGSTAAFQKYAMRAQQL